MNYTHTIRRFALAAAVSGVAFSAAPALADAASTCTYNPDTKSVIVDDFSGPNQLVISRTAAGKIRISDHDSSSGTSTSAFCPTDHGNLQFATVTNTDQINVFGDASNVNSVDGYAIDERTGVLGPGATPETDGNSEIEVKFNTPGIPAPVSVVGTDTTDPLTHGGDIIAAGASGINLGYTAQPGLDEDVDVTWSTTPTAVSMFGLSGNDSLSGAGNQVTGNLAPATYNVELHGGNNDDSLLGGLAVDTMQGDQGNDHYFAPDKVRDSIFDSSGTDEGFFDTLDRPEGVETEFIVSTVGRLKLTPNLLQARVGTPARVTLAWTHPHGWKQLRSLTLRARDAGNVAGAIVIHPANGSTSSHGALTATRTTTVRHHGKTVFANLVLRAAKRLAGHGLELEVQATDIHGHTQLEPLGGKLIVRS